jgi:hypothetical protein
MDAVGVATQRPEPAKHLTKVQKEIWQRVTSELPIDWFRAETLDMLAEYCEVVTMSRKVGRAIDKLPVDAPATEIERLVRVKDKASRLVTTLATKMRLTQQSSYDRERVKGGAPPASDPWLTLV